MGWAAIVMINTVPVTKFGENNRAAHDLIVIATTIYISPRRKPPTGRMLLTDTRIR
jgi:hypothetical protein